MLKVEEDFDDCNVGDEEEGSEAQEDPCGLGSPEDVQSQSRSKTASMVDDRTLVLSCHQPGREWGTLEIMWTLKAFERKITCMHVTIATSQQRTRVI